MKKIQDVITMRDFFIEEIDYVLRYLSFLISNNNENSKFLQFHLGLTSNTNAMP